MRIQARLFLGTSILVLALMAVQWWLHVRQVKALETQLGQVAALVGKGLLSGPVWFGSVEADSINLQLTQAGESEHGSVGHVSPVKVEEKHARTQLRAEVHMLVTDDVNEAPPESEQGAASGTQAAPPQVFVVDELRRMPEPSGETSSHPEAASTSHGRAVAVLGDDDIGATRRRYELKVVQKGPGEIDRVLIVQSDTGQESRIPIPVASTVDLVTANQRKGLAFSAALLMVGLVASGVMARRVARPLQELAANADALGQGQLGAQVELSASGEVGELQAAFNRMSEQLRQLEREREKWRQREHLVQLGQLSKGLAHTLRNPLNTIGLVIEELAGGGTPGPQMIPTARAQIVRIDRWLRSFLALGAAEAANPARCDLAQIVREAVLESGRGSVRFELVLPEEPIHVCVVEGAIRAALGNLLENAAEASAPEQPVRVVLSGEDREAVVRIVDHGSGLPEPVRESLFSPHVTTKSGGSGMGLYLARQLVVEMHGGRLELNAGVEEGTEVLMGLPRAAPLGAENEEPEA